MAHHDASEVQSPEIKCRLGSVWEGHCLGMDSRLGGKLRMQHTYEADEGDID